MLENAEIKIFNRIEENTEKDPKKQTSDEHSRLKIYIVEKTEI